MKIEAFAVEQWMDEWETKCELNLAETCVQSLTIAELLELAGQNSDDLTALLDMQMTYGAIRGSDRLRAAISALYANQSPENIIVAHGAIGANMLVHKALVERGDKVIAIVPSYQQHYSIPAAIGADVQPLHLRAKNGYLPDIDELRALVCDGAKLIAMTNPNNPTGALIERPMLEEIAEIARAAGAWVLCDEVYRGLNQSGEGRTASMADIYEKAISTGGMSKAYSLAGLRLGWAAGPSEVIEAISVHRDYDTIAVGMINDHFAAMALEAKDRVLARSKAITRQNLAALEKWIAHEPLLSWVKPQSGTTTLLTYNLDMPSRDFCVALLAETGVMLTPGSAFGLEGCVRIGFANSPAILNAGLERMSDFLRKRA